MSIKGLGLILLISLGIHILAMSAVSIVSYEGPGRTTPYTRIDFLGPILGKTSFDLMLRTSAKAERPSIKEETSLSGENILKVRAANKAADAAEFPDSQEKALDASIAGSLVPGSTAPETRAQSMVKRAPSGVVTNVIKTRKVISRPDAPSFLEGQYGDKTYFRIKIKVMVNDDGNVVRAEPMTTTGYPQLDIAAAKYAERWIYEPSTSSPAGGEWIEEEIVLKAGD